MLPMSMVDDTIISGRRMIVAPKRNIAELRAKSHELMQ